jgi:hypothetical protein
VTTSFAITPAESLRGPRVYSTDLHPIHFRGGPLTPEASRTLLRKIKAKLLTRGVVTLNGAHLIQPAISGFLRQNEALLSHGLLLPAMREDRANFAEYALDHEEEYRSQGWSPEDITTSAAFVDNHVEAILPWRVEQAAGNFRENLLQGFSSANSAIYQRLRSDAMASQYEISAFVRRLETVDSSEERAVASVMREAPASWQTALGHYSQACYHLVGAKVANCEAGLDLTSLSQMRMEEFLRRDGSLTDDEICLRLFLEAAIEVIGSAALPEVLIDSVSLSDLARIRAALRQEGFQTAYDQLLGEFFAAMSLPRAGVNALNVSRVVSLATDLSAHFRNYLRAEFPNYRARLELERRGRFFRNAVSTVKSVLGVVPGISMVFSIADAVHSGVMLAKEGIDLGTAMADRRVALSDARETRERDLRLILERLASSKSAVLLTAVRELHALAVMNMQAP